MSNESETPDSSDTPDWFEDYQFWLELNACTYCDGLGEDEIEELDDPVWVCPHCDGSGIEPDAEYDGPLPG